VTCTAQRLDGREGGLPPGHVIKISQKLQRYTIDQISGRRCCCAGLWEIVSVKSSSKALKQSVNKPKSASAKTKKVTAAGDKSLVKKNNQNTTKPTRIPKKPKTASPTPRSSLKPRKLHKEDFSFSVTPEFRKRFKKAAKEAGHKKAEFLQILLASWQDRNSTQAETKA
jgi:hypothetical protein